MLLASSQAQKLAPFFDETAVSLKCYYELKKPTLDFAARFVARYTVGCKFPSSQPPGSLLTYIRVTPEGRDSVFLGTAWKFGGKDEESKPSILSSSLELRSGGSFAVGQGKYLVDFLLTDDQGRTSRKRWKIGAGIGASYAKIPVNIQPLAVEPTPPKWDVAAPSQSGLRLTVILHALGSHHRGYTLLAPDRDFLLQSLYSLAKRVPYRSLRVVAFSLGQQQEIFREDNVDDAAFQRLSDSLASLQTATISVSALRTSGSPRLAIELANREAHESSPPDVVVFLGQVAYLDMWISSGAITRAQPHKPLFVSFVYDPSNTNLEDVLQRLSKSVDGKTFRFHSPMELQRQIQELAVHLNPTRAAVHSDE